MTIDFNSGVLAGTKNVVVGIDTIWISSRASRVLSRSRQRGFFTNRPPAAVRKSRLEARVEAPVLDRLGDVLGGDRSLVGKIGDRARRAQHAVIGARREQQARERMAQQLVAFVIGSA